MLKNINSVFISCGSTKQNSLWSRNILWSYRRKFYPYTRSHINTLYRNAKRVHGAGNSWFQNHTFHFKHKQRKLSHRSNIREQIDEWKITWEHLSTITDKAVREGNTKKYYETMNKVMGKYSISKRSTEVPNTWNNMLDSVRTDRASTKSWHYGALLHN